MNIFYLDKNPKKCAEYHCDKHVIKMILESMQMLSTAHRVLDGKLNKKYWELNDYRENFLYKATHINHPSNIWVRNNLENYLWLYEMTIYLGEEYTNRYNKNHKSILKLGQLIKNPPFNIKNDYFFDPPKAMPNEVKLEDTVESYRNYYKINKRSFATWKTNIPEWFL